MKLSKALIITSLLFSGTALADDYKLIEMEYFDMIGAKFEDKRDPYLPQYDNQWTYRIQSNMRFSVMGVVYFEQHPHFEAVPSSPKTVAYPYTLGIRLTDNLDIFKMHESDHCFECDKPTVGGRNQFPVEDSYGIKLTVVPESGKRNSIYQSFFGK